MAINVMSWVWSESASKGTDRLVLLAIADAADDDGTNAWPSMATLARKTKVDTRTVQRSIRRLESSGELIVKTGAGRHGTNEYVVTFVSGTVPPLAECHPGTMPPSPRQDATLPPAERHPTPGTVPPNPSLPVLDPSLTHPPRESSCFGEFWAEYPRKVNKADARKAYKSAAKRTSEQSIVEAARRLRDDPNLPEAQFIPYPATWLRADGWENGPLAPRHGAESGKKPWKPTPGSPLSYVEM